MSKTKSPIGAVFPISATHAKRIFEDKKIVFVKFTGMSNFKAGSKIVFYVTKEKALLGEGTVRMIQRVSPTEAWDKHCKDLFLNQEEYNSYTNWSSVEAKPRKQTEITVFTLKNVKKYDKPKPIKGITSSGRCLSEEEYNTLSP
ncbi:MAG TPA: DUF365 domain-containing protein [Candidatus Acidoferrales bacterium]|nr:DUF365 domain-containing protein [Candidatus Acidoferrales bacterium]